MSHITNQKIFAITNMEMAAVVCAMFKLVSLLGQKQASPAKGTNQIDYGAIRSLATSSVLADRRGTP
jgi:hypothetical protein